jgi:hypothetical protein
VYSSARTHLVQILKNYHHRHYYHNHHYGVIIRVNTVKLLIGAGALIYFKGGLDPAVIRDRRLLAYILSTIF